MRVVLGGNFVHNSTSFIEDLLHGTAAEAHEHAIHIAP